MCAISEWYRRCNARRAPDGLPPAAGARRTALRDTSARSLPELPGGQLTHLAPLRSTLLNMKLLPHPVRFSGFLSLTVGDCGVQWWTVGRSVLRLACWWGSREV